MTAEQFPDVSLDRMKDLFIDTFELDLEKDEIADNIVLFGEGLELDSIDALEIMLQVEKTFGIKMADPNIDRNVFQNLSSFTKHVISLKQQTAGDQETLKH